MENSKFELLEVASMPSLPAPWSSVDSGETWIWGDFFLTFQRKPKVAFDVLMEMLGKKDRYQRIVHQYAMSVFYRVAKSPHGPSHRPIMTVALEQVDIKEGKKVIQGAKPELRKWLARLLTSLTEDSGDDMGPLMIGLFRNGAHANFGEYDGAIDRAAVRERFFDILRPQLGVSGKPKLIGNLAQAHGHPETGLPSKH